ncbi:MAG TPA: DUF3800 domain-containing protein [Candidatus Aquilonibacter sp.]|nr:DUF3800 domain-containing protein [Candidatus Aquilonibacter sp.]
MIYVYGDESMDEKKEIACAVAAIVGTKEQWEAIESKWLERTKGIPFHANNCDSDQGDYKNIPHQENKALYRDLTIMLAESGLRGFGSVVDLAAQAKAFPLANPLDLSNRTYYKCFIDVVEKMFFYATNINEIAEMTFDNRAESDHNAALLYANMRELNPGWKSRLASKIIFESARENPCIQVADLFAREVMKGLVNDMAKKKRPVRKSWETLVATNRFASFGYSTEWFADMVADLPAASVRFDFDPEGYQKWLGNRQDSLTAFIEYSKVRFKKVFRPEPSD